MASYVFTPEMAVISNNLWAVTSAVGAGLCFLVLIVIAAVYSHPKSRPHLDRVSFRIVVYTLIANMFFGISSAVGGWLTGPGFLCGFSIFILQITLQFSSFLLFCIALNLQLVVVHGFNGQRLQKFYLLGSTVLALALTIPPYAARQYGWDPLEKDCWYTNDNKAERLLWQVTTQMMWTALMFVGEVVCSITVMTFMLGHAARLRNIFTPMSQPITTFESSMPSSSQVIRVNSYRQIILRIALYPLASCVVNLLSVVTALHSTIADGIHNSNDYRILLLSDFLYGGRAIVYALLALSDPALVRGTKTLYSHLRYGSASNGRSTDKTSAAVFSSTIFSRQHSPTNSAMVVHVELSTISSPDYPPHTVKSASSTQLPLPTKSSDEDADSPGGPNFVPGSNETAGVPPSTDIHNTFMLRQRDLEMARMLQREEDQQEAFKRQI